VFKGKGCVLWNAVRADCISVFLICAASLLTLLLQGCVKKLSCVMVFENSFQSALFRLKDGLGRKELEEVFGT